GSPPAGSDLASICLRSPAPPDAHQQWRQSFALNNLPVHPAIARGCQSSIPCDQSVDSTEPSASADRAPVSACRAHAPPRNSMSAPPGHPGPCWDTSWARHSLVGHERSPEPKPARTLYRTLDWLEPDVPPVWPGHRHAAATAAANDWRPAPLVQSPE